jgi:hypothetical protein
MLIFEYIYGGQVKSGIAGFLKLVAQLIGISTSRSQKTTEKRETRFELFRQRDVAHAEQRKDDREQ